MFHHDFTRRQLLKGGLAAGLAGAFTPLAHAQNKRILIGATSASSSQYGYYVAVSQLINAQLSGISSSVVETGATMDNLRRIARNQMDIGLVTTNVMYDANAGTGAFDGQPQDARLLWVYSIAPQNAVVRRDANIQSLQDLAGKRFNPGLKGSATEKTAEAVFELLGIAPDWVRGSTGEIVDAVKDNRLTGYVKSGVGDKLDASSQEIAAFTPVRVLSLTAEQRQAIEESMPQLSLVDVPADASNKIDAYATWGFGLGVAAAGDLDAQLAYDIVKTVCEDDKKQAAALADVAGADFGELTVKYAASPLHPGAVQYFREQGYDIPEKLLG